jgi:hypothetical protein
MQLKSDELQFLARLSRTPDGATLLKLLRAKLAEADGELRKAQGENVYRAQGHAQELDELISLIVDAEQQLKRIEASRPRLPSYAP